MCSSDLRRWGSRRRRSSHRRRAAGLAAASLNPLEASSSSSSADPHWRVRWGYRWEPRRWQGPKAAPRSPVAPPSVALWRPAALPAATAVPTRRPSPTTQPREAQTRLVHLAALARPAAALIRACSRGGRGSKGGWAVLVPVLLRQELRLRPGSAVPLGDAAAPARHVLTSERPSTARQAPPQPRAQEPLCRRRCRRRGCWLCRCRCCLPKATLGRRPRAHRTLQPWRRLPSTPRKIPRRAARTAGPTQKEENRDRNKGVSSETGAGKRRWLRNVKTTSCAARLPMEGCCPRPRRT